jgi:NmrA-like family
MQTQLQLLSRYCNHELLLHQVRLISHQDANIIFSYTNFFEPFATSGPEIAMQVEYSQGVNLAKAASATSSVEHYIWSTLPDRKAISNGKNPVPHCDAKAQVDVFIKQDLALLAKTTFLWPSFFAATLHYPMFVPNLLVRSPPLQITLDE